MKVLCINGVFLLPDDFNGSESDAIQLMAEYHTRALRGETTIEPRESKNKAVLSDKLWLRFLEAVKDGYRLSMGIFCGEVGKYTHGKLRHEK